MFKHELYFRHDRIPYDTPFDHIPPANSTVTIDADAQDIVAAWSELISRLPDDLYAGLKTAIEMAEK